MVDMTAESVADAFAYGWIASYGCPSTITTDRGGQFSSDLFTQLTKTWGIRIIMTTPYHPEANGLVERFHRRLKESLLALATEEPHDWYWRLPCALLAIRTTLKPDVGASPADLLYGEGLSVPGETLPSNPASEDHLARRRMSTLADARIEVSRLQPTQTSAHRKPLVHLPQQLEDCTHVFIRRGGVQSTLSTPYSGPFRVKSRNNVNFRVAVPGRPDQTVSISRVKPVFMDAAEAEEAEPDSPRGPGRPPRALQHPPPPRQQPRRQSRPRQPSPPSPTPPVASDSEIEVPAPRRNPRRVCRRPNVVHIDVNEPLQRRSPSPVPIVPNPPDDEIQDTSTDPLPPPSWFGSPPAARPVSPDWFSPPPQRDPSPARAPPRRRLFSNPQTGDFSYRPPPPPPPPAASQQPVQETSQRPQNKPIVTRFLSKGGTFSRRRPDVSALNSFLRTHLDLPTPSPTLDDPGASERGFFPPISHIEM